MRRRGAAFLAVLALCHQIASAQINLGTFNLGQDPAGQWNLGFNQAANLFGFGGDRGIGFTAGDRGFGMQTNGGALVAGERVGVDSGLGVDRGSGLGLGSILSFGNAPSFSPAGQLQDFLHNVGRFFANILPAARPPQPAAPLGSVGVPDTTDFTPATRRQPDDSAEARAPATHSTEFATLRPTLEESIDSDVITALPGRKKTPNPRQLPGLVDMDSEFKKL